MILRLAGCALLLSGAAAVARAQVSVELRDNGKGRGPEALAMALLGSHLAIAPGTKPYVVAGGASINRTLVVIGRDAVIDGSVHGDVFVVDGGLFMHPGARIDGRAITIGGGVYESMLATIGGGISSFRDFTYDVAPVAGGVVLTYRSLQGTHQDVFSLPGIYGLRLPLYDRSDGLSRPASARPFGRRSRTFSSSRR